MIVHIIPTLREVDGGTSTYFREYLKLDHRHDNVIICLSFDLDDLYNVKVIRLFSKECFRLVSKSGLSYHFHGLWHPIFILFKILTKFTRGVYFLSPHGMALPWCLTHKRLKKKAAWFLYQRGILEAAKKIHLTNAQEYDEIRKLILNESLAIIPHPIQNSRQKRLFSNEPVLNLVFLSRIDEKKGLLELLHGLKMVTSKFKLTIVGDNSSEYGKICMDFARETGLNPSLDWLGLVRREEVFTILAESNFFILPSKSENFGFAIGEAMSVGVPVIIGENLPWQDVDELKLGYRIPVNAMEIANLLNEISGISYLEWLEMSENCSRYIESHFSAKNIEVKYIEFYA